MANEEIPVSYGTQSDNIRELQTYLREISNAYSDVRPVYPDGVYGKSTAGAVSDYQQIKGLPVTGEADLATWEAIADDYYDIMANLKEQKIALGGGGEKWGDLGQGVQSFSYTR